MAVRTGGERGWGDPRVHACIPDFSLQDGVTVSVCGALLWPPQETPAPPCLAGLPQGPGAGLSRTQKQRVLPCPALLRLAFETSFQPARVWLP